MVYIMKKVIVIFIVIISIFFINGYLINTHTFKVTNKNITITNLPESYKGFKIMQISDLLMSSSKDIEMLESIVKKVNDNKVDIIVFTGDLFNSKFTPSNEEINNITKILNKLDCKLYKYAVIGDNDNNETYKNIMSNINFQVLDNASTYVFYKDIKPIKISGVTNTENIDNTLATEDNYETAFNLVITHYPDYMDELKDKNIDVILAGHTLNGQIKIPFYGGIIKQKLGKNYLNSEYEINNTKMFISSGIGTNNFKFRLFNKPEINLFTFY